MKKKIVKFMLYVFCIPKGKRRHYNTRVATSQYNYDTYQKDKQEIISLETRNAFERVNLEVSNKNIKDVKSAYLVVREVELDGDFETYMPFDDVKITIPV